MRFLPFPMLTVIYADLTETFHRAAVELFRATVV